MTLQFLSSKRVEGLDAEKDTIPVNALESGYSFTALDTPQEYIWNGVDTWVPIGGSSLAQQPWIEIARTTLTVQGQSLLISNMPNMMYYMVLHRGIRVSGSFNPKMSFNGDIAGNYSARGNTNFGADFTAPSATLGMGQGISDANSYFQYSTILNRQNFQKMAQIHAVTQEGVGAAIVPRSGIEFDKWVDTTQPIFNRFVVSIV